jgi:hypothetical protein
MNMRNSVESFGTGDVNLDRGQIQVRGNTVFYRGELLFGEDVTRIIEYLSEGFPAESLVRFLERKLQNPSKQSIESLYGFLANKGMPTTDAGTFLGYKGLSGNYTSRWTGSEPLISGKRLPNGAIDNHVGQLIRMDRKYVCEDFNSACAPGLHVGSLEYAKGHAGSDGKVVIVSVDPADVVSVPTNEKTKLRVCAYTVVGEYYSKLNDVYDNSHVRPPTAIVTEDPSDEEEEPVPENDGEAECNCDCEYECGCVRLTEKVASVISRKPSPIMVWTDGFERGKKDGIGHAKRLFYEVDKGTSTKKYCTDFIDGYLDGYRTYRTK